MDKAIEKKITCLNRLIGRCPECTEDYTPHHPNNLDCKDYKGIIIYKFYIKEVKDG